MFHPIDPKPNFPELERALLDRWDIENIFERSVSERPADKEWSFYDGPPFATGLPHYGHLLAGTMKDLVPRFWTMRGFRVRRVWGWDCHGLPVEYEIEKDLKINGKQEIEAMGVDVFNAACRATVLRYTDEWAKTVRRIGRWVDMANAYRTMDPDFMESVWWVVRTLWDKDLLYKGHKSMHLCPRCATPLSNIEVSMNYKDVTDPSVVVTFPLLKDPEVSVLAWTTTPWTLPGNVLLAVNPAIAYVEALVDGKRYILAKDRVEPLFGEDVQIVRVVPAEELVGQTYVPIFPFYADTEKAFRIVAADFVTAEDGTGVVHIAPAFGDDDYQLGKREKISLVQHITTSGTFVPETDWLAGKDARGANRDIVRHLQEDGRLVKEIPLTHSYPHCWRCETPLLNYANASWFVKVEHFRDHMVETNKTIHWVPEHLRDGRFGKWVENARDWNISRNRYWGTPLPIWECACGERLVVGSREELMERSDGTVTKVGERYMFEGAELDLHKHVVDRIELTCTSGDCHQKMRRISEVLDCWFESGSMPYAQRHYPFENKAEVERTYPADFIGEGLDQTRGWFYLLHVLANALELKGTPSPAFKNVIVNGLVLAEDGQKMSKRKKNYPDPNLLIEKYGADAIRFAFMASPAVRAEDLRFSEKLVGEVVKSVNLPVWNTLSFFATYASAAEYASSPLPTTLDDELDRWIVASTEALTAQITACYEAYDLQGAVRPVVDFLDGLTNWYVRRSRGRFAQGGDHVAMATLEYVLERLALLLAPVMPFLAELVWERLGRDSSVHLAAWPDADASRIDADLLARVATARRIVGLGLSVRASARIPVRQPLASATVGLPSTIAQDDVAPFRETLAEELNVLELRFEAPEAIAVQTLTPNPRVLGKRLGGAVQTVLRAAKAGEYELLDDGSASVAGHMLLPEEFALGFTGAAGAAVASEGGIVVALDTEITPALAKAGELRVLARAINDQRKAAGLSVGDPAKLTLSEEIDIDEAMRAKLSLVAVEFGEVPEDAASMELGEKTVRLMIKKA